MMRSVRRIPHLWIPLPDGSRLAGRLWLPVDAEDRPVPALLEAVPYRKGDLTAAADARWHAHLARGGYACLRLDIRGSGDSEGLLHDEYLAEEQADNAAVIAWLARQPWCTGRVGMLGYSWGGFAALQTAALAPPALGAVLSHCSTDDRYLGDCHWMGGCLLGSDMLKWATWLLAYLALPPDPDAVGPSWRRQWQARLQALVPPAEHWLAHPLRDAYWDQGSVRQDPLALRCPVLATGGWADPYVDTVFRLASVLQVPFHGLVGPWSHTWPDAGLPGPAIGYWDLALRWFDHWLKGEAPEVATWPRLRCYLQDSRPPDPAECTVPGRWLALEGPGRPRQVDLAAVEEGVAGALPAASAIAAVPQDLRIGAQAGVWCPAGRPGELPADQAPDDALSLCLESRTSKGPRAVVGIPCLTLRVRSSSAWGQVAARLCDVAPGGQSLLVSWGLLNLRRVDDHRRDLGLEAGVWVERRLPLRALGHRLAPGHRWRLTLSASYWPHAWPAPEAGLLELDLAGLKLDLPELAEADAAPAPEVADGPGQAAAPFGPPIGALVDLPTPNELRPASWVRRRRDLPGGGICITDRGDGGAWRDGDGVLTAERSLDRYRLGGDTGGGPELLAWREIRVGRSGWEAKVLAAGRLWSTDSHFHLSSRVIACWEGEQVWSLRRLAQFPRQGA